MTREQYAPTLIDVTEMLDTNAGDEHHEDDNWTECGACGYDNPADYNDCTFCGASL